MGGALNLHIRGATPRRRMIREGQIVCASIPPPPIGALSLACLVPALDKVVMHVGNRRACELDIDIVVVPFAAVTRCDEGVWIEIDAADKGCRRIEIGIDEPRFLMLTVAGVCPIPTDFDMRITL